MEDHRASFGSTIRAFEVIDADAQQRLWNELEGVFRRYNRATEDTAKVEYQCLQTMAVRA